MKVARERALLRYKFDDGTTGEVDFVKALRKVAADYQKMAFVAELEGRDQEARHHEHRALVYETHAAEIESLPQRAKLARLREQSHKGGKATAERFARPQLDDLIRSCLVRGEKIRDYKKVWASDFNVSVDTIERRVKRVKAKIAK